MDDQLMRILNSNLEVDVVATIETNETEINKLEDLLRQKNSQVSHLHDLINNEMQSLIAENQKLRKANAVYCKGMAGLKRYCQDIKNQLQKNAYAYGCELMGLPLVDQITKFIKTSKYNSAKSEQQSRIRTMLQNKQIRKQAYFDDSTQTPQHSIHESCTQTEPQAKTQPNNQLLLRLEQLQQYVITLKQQKWNLQKQLSKYKNFQSIAPSEQDYSSTRSLNEDEKRKLVWGYIESSFKDLKEVKFTGQLIGNMKNGEGVCEYEEGFTYEGMFVSGKRHGLGEIRYNGDLVYRGYWNSDLIDGKGVLLFLPHPDIDKYCGTFRNGAINGYGTLVYGNGRRVIGKFTDGIPAGSSLLEDEQNGLHFGVVVRNQFHSKHSGEVFAI